MRAKLGWAPQTFDANATSTVLYMPEVVSVGSSRRSEMYVDDISPTRTGWEISGTSSGSMFRVSPSIDVLR